MIDPFLADFSFSDYWNETLSNMLETSLAGDFGAARKIWWDSGLFTPAMANPGAARQLSSIFDRYSGWHFKNPLSLGVSAVSARLEEIKVPTLILVGDKDIQDFHDISLFLERKIPDVRRCVVSGAGHMANLEAPLEVNQAILDFLD